MRRQNFLGAAASTSALALAPKALTAAAGAAPASSASTIPITGRAVPELAIFDRVMVELLQTYGIPGGQCAVAKDGRLVYARGFGYVDSTAESPPPVVSPTARFRIASCTKPFTAVATLRLVELGRLRLDERPYDILRDFTPPPGEHTDPRLRDITVEHLLQHSGGFAFPTADGFDPQFQGLRVAADAFHHPYPATAVDIIRWVAGKPLKNAPGTVYNYSNLGYNVLGRIIERRTAMPYAAALKTLVLDPAGLRSFALMTRTSPQARLPDEVSYYDSADAIPGYSIYADDPFPRSYAYGGFDGRAIDAHGGGIANAPDLTRFLNAVDGTTGPQLLLPGTVRSMLGRPPKIWPPTGHYYGLGWDVNPPARVVASHAGAISFGTFSVIFRLEDGITFAALFNHLDLRIDVMGLDVENKLTAAGYSIKNWPATNMYSQMS